MSGKEGEVERVDGRAIAYVCLHKGPGRRGILLGGLRGGGPGRPPFWRTLISPTERWGWTPVNLKINTRHTEAVRTPAGPGKAEDDESGGHNVV